ncbi:MAG: tubulin-like doman-containing protein [Acidobacteriota bacterium]
MSNGQQQIIPVRPTVFVGLGGTGKEILLRLRMKFFGRYGVVGYPCISYIWIDTDMQNQNVDRQAMDPIFQKVLFTQGEQVDIRVPNPEDFLNNPSKFPWITEWMPPAIAQSSLRIQDGAGQVRAKGRFAFFWKFQEVRENLRNAIIKVRNPQARTDTSDFSLAKELNLKLDEKWGPHVNFFLVTSLAGGTGSGTFLDTAFLIREIGSSLGFTPDITGLMFLASLFTNDPNHRVFANCYASLKELEYYNYAPEAGARNVEGETRTQTYALRKFEEKWLQNDPQKPINGPPFNTCYLIDGFTYDGTPVTPDHKYEVFDMAAEYLFWEFYRGEFASQKRTIRPNNRQYLDRNIGESHTEGEKEIHSQRFSTGYSSFGLSWISVPIASRIGACAYRLSQEILEFWERGGVTSKEVAQDQLKNKNVVEAMRKAVVSDALALTRRGLIDDLAKTAQGTRFSEVLKNGIESYFQQPRAGEEPPTPESVFENAGKFEDQYLARRKGAIIHDHLGPAMNRVVASLKEKTRNWAISILQEEGFIPLLGFAYTEADGIQKKVDGYLDVLLQIVLPELVGEVQASRDEEFDTKASAEQRKEVFLNNIEELDRNFVLYRRHSREILLRRCKETELAYADAYVGEWVCEQALTSIAEIKEYLTKEIKTDLKRFYDGILSPLIGEFGDMKERHAKEDRRTLSIPLYESLEKYYRLSGNPVDVRDEKEQLFRTRMPDLWEVITQWTEDKLKKQVEDYGWDRFQKEFQRRFAAGATEEHLANAVKLFNEKYPPSDKVNRSNAVRIFLGGGKPYVQPHPALGPRAPDPNQDIFLGLPGVTPPSQPGQGFLVELRNDYSLSAAQAIETEPEAILYYHELTGLPLFYLSSLGQYRRSYEEFQGRLGDLPVHFHRRADRFPEISRYVPDEARGLNKAWEMIILGTILRVLQVEASGDDFRYFYYRGLGANTEVIGDEKGAVKTLFNSLTKYAWCSQEIERRKNEICSSQAGLEGYYGVLQLFRDEIFPVDSATLASGEVVGIPSFQSSVVENLIHEVEYGPAKGNLAARNPQGPSPEWDELLRKARNDVLAVEVDRDSGRKDRRYFIKSVKPFVRT